MSFSDSLKNLPQSNSDFKRDFNYYDIPIYEEPKSEIRKKKIKKFTCKKKPLLDKT